MGFNVAIDGPAGAGKSTIAKTVAKNMQFIYVDTGAMYRTIGFYMLRNGISVDDPEAVAAHLSEVDVTLGYEDGVQQVYLNGENVSASIRTQEVGEAASKVSAMPPVRAALLNLQRNLARSADILMDGRDIGTVVLPDADVKVFLTASSLVRAKRRYDELTAKGTVCDLAVIQKEIEERDYRDMHREIAPLKQAADAVLVDSSDMTIDEVVAEIIRLINAARAGKVL